METNNPLKKIEGMVLCSIEFVMDYYQIRFIEYTINVLSNSVIVTNNAAYEQSSPEFYYMIL